MLLEALRDKQEYQENCYAKERKMEIIFNGNVVFDLSDNQIQVIKNDISSVIFDRDMTRRCKYWLEIPQDKYAHTNKQMMRSELGRVGATTIPSNLLKLAVEYARVFQSRYGDDGITQDIRCSVGDTDFAFSEDHQKVFRNAHDAQQQTKTLEEYLAYEQNIFETTMAWILQHKYERCLDRLRVEWTLKLEAREIADVPIDDQAFCNLVFSQDDYKDKEARDEEDDF